MNLFLTTKDFQQWELGLRAEDFPPEYLLPQAGFYVPNANMLLRVGCACTAITPVFFSTFRQLFLNRQPMFQYQVQLDQEQELHLLKYREEETITTACDLRGSGSAAGREARPETILCPECQYQFWKTHEHFAQVYYDAQGYKNPGEE